MADTGFVRFNTVDSSEWTDASNLIATNTGEAGSAIVGQTFFLSGLNLNIPNGSTINGLEYQYSRKYTGAGVASKISSDVRVGGEDPQTTNSDSLMTISYSLITFGSSTTTQGLTLTSDNIEDLRIRISHAQSVATTMFVEGSNSPFSPAVKVYYTLPSQLPPTKAVRSSGMYVRES